MSENLLALLAILPGIAIAILIWYLDKQERENPRNLIGIFFLGGAIVIPALLVQNFSIDMGLNDMGNIGQTLLFTFIIIALTEETMKFLTVRYFLMPKKYFNEPMDGIVYAVMLSMGFATIENIMYTVNEGFEVGVLRMFTAVPAHAIFAVIMGYYLGKAKFDKINKSKLLARGFAVPVLLHGLYDFLVLQNSFEYLTLGAFVVLIAGLVLAIKFIRELMNDSQERIEYGETSEPVNLS